MVEIEKQFNIYKIIHLNSSIQSQFQKKLFDTVNKFQVDNEKKFQQHLVAKSKRYNLLDFQISLVKIGTLVKTKTLESISKNIKTVSEVIEDLDFRNRNMWNDNKFIENNFIHYSNLLKDLMENLKVETVDEIINIFQTVKFKYDTCYNEVKYHIKSLSLKE